MRGELRLFPRYVHSPEQLTRWRAQITQTFQAYLKQRRLRATAPRQAVVEFLMNARNHVGVDDIYGALRRQRGIGRATVFRTLKLLEACGLASRVSGKDAAGRYELKYERPHHDHLICVECGTIIEFQSPEMERYQNEAVKRRGFQMLWHRHEIFGRCRACPHDDTLR